MRLGDLITAAVLALSMPANVFLLRKPTAAAEQPADRVELARQRSESARCERTVTALRGRLHATATDPPLETDDAHFEARARDEHLTEKIRHAIGHTAAGASSKLDVDCRQSICRLSAAPGEALARDELESDPWMSRHGNRVLWGERSVFVELRSHELADGRALLEETLRAFLRSGAVQRCGPAPEPIAARLDLRGEQGGPDEPPGISFYLGASTAPGTFAGCVAEGLRHAVAEFAVPPNTSNATLLAKIPEPPPPAPPPPAPPPRPKMPWQKYD